MLAYQHGMSAMAASKLAWRKASESGENDNGMARNAAASISIINGAASNERRTRNAVSGGENIA